jgi:exopolysaccharide biosynthesis polyprenyl glycosylphosphotransferase
MRYSIRLIVGSTLAKVDAVIAAVSLLISLVVIDQQVLGSPHDLQMFLGAAVSLGNLIRVAFVIAFWIAISKGIGLYADRYQAGLPETLRIVFGVTMSAAVLRATLYVGSHPGAAGVVASFAALSFACMVFARALVAALTGRAWARVQTGRTVVIVGTGSRALRFYRELRTRQFRSHRLLGFVDNKLREECPPEIGSMLLGGLSDISDILLRNVVDEVYIAPSSRIRFSEIRRIVGACQRAGVELKYPADLLPEGSTSWEKYGKAARTETITIKPASNDSRLFVKRFIDLLVSGAAILALAPVMILTAIAVKATTPGPVLFAQDRYGLGRRRFRMYKFRSMVQDAEARLTDLETLNEASGPIFKIRQDPRLTRIGSFLRRSSLDELPQLFNVFVGDMSLVGPRPMSVRDVSLFSECWLMRRFSVKPGITGLWQVNGRSNTSFSRWMELDLRYIDSWSLILDTRILAATIPAIMKGSGAM